LGFKQTQLDAKFKTLSGGWRSRCSLASALLQQPDLVRSMLGSHTLLICIFRNLAQLMLDESTNYLDIMSVIWLQYYLKTISSTLLMVAHDREFVDAIAQETIILRNKKLTYFNGNLTESERHARSERKGKIRMQEAMDKKRGAIEKSIEMGARSAKKTGDENRARMVKSRQKKLEDRWGMERSDKGTRWGCNFGTFLVAFLILAVASSSIVIWPDFTSQVALRSKLKISIHRSSSTFLTQSPYDFPELSFLPTASPSLIRVQQQEYWMM
jgi:ATP-binding cassette subfamily F protein 3